MAKNDEHLEILLPQIARRVGLEPASRLRWLLSFVNTEGAGDPNLIDLEARMFAQGDGWNTDLFTRFKPEKNPEELLILAREFKQKLGNLISGKHFELWTHSHVRHTAVLPKDGTKVLVSHWGDSLVDTLTTRAFELIVQHARQIQACKRCSNFFLEDRAGQSYCSPKCAQADRNARYIAKQKKGGKAKS